MKWDLRGGSDEAAVLVFVEIDRERDTALKRVYSHPTRRKRQYNPMQVSAINPITMK